MEIVVRTPHGAADVALSCADPAAATIADVLRSVTGQAVPAQAWVDGRRFDTTTSLADAGVAMGSTVETSAGNDGPDGGELAGAHGDRPVAALLVLAGPGSGTIRPLPPGRYRIGPGRRIAAPELDVAPVELTALELTVGDDGSVEVRPGYAGPVAINGQEITGPSPWNGGMLTVDDRVVAIESPPIEVARRLRPTDAAGIVTFLRPARTSDDGPRYLVVDALRDAVGPRPALWRQHAGDLAAFTVPIGLAGDPPGPITIDLAAGVGVAIVGGGSFVRGVAHTVLVEATTLHGPGDLDITIATRPGRLGRWDWAKWLPHLRGPAGPRFVTDESQLQEWVAHHRLGAVGAAGQLSRAHVSLLVADDPELWSTGASPLSTLLASHPPGLRLLALAEDGAAPPAPCTTVVTAVGEGRRARLVVADRAVDVDGVVPALTGTETAETVARSLAPLADAGHGAVPVPPPLGPGPASLDALLAPVVSRFDRIAHVWRRAAPPHADSLAVPFGLGEDELVMATIGVRHNVLVRSDRADSAADVALGVVAALAAQLPPDAFTVVHVGGRSRTPLDAIDELPHFAGRFVEPGAVAAARLVVRLGQVAGGWNPAERRLLVVVDDGGQAVRTSPGLVAGLLELAAALPAIHVLMTTVDGTAADAVRRDAFAVRIRIDGAGDQRRGSLRVDEERLQVPFAPYARPDGDPDRSGLAIRPVVYGRPLTLLERRLESLAARAESATTRADVGGFLSALRAAAATVGAEPPPSLVPGPLPSLHRAETLLAEQPGDAVPVGLVDRPEHGDAVPLWWQPGGRGSWLLLGSPRSGVDSALSTIVLGIAGRASADDVHLYCIDHLPQRRAAAALLPHTGAAVAPDEPEAAAALVAWLAGECERRRAGGPRSAAAQPAIVLLLHDLGRLHRSAGGSLARALDQLAGAAPLGINVVATAYRPDEAGQLLDRFGERYVGALADPDDMARLGVRDHVAIAGQIGRCWSTTAERVVQLALPPSPLAAEISRLAPRPARRRPPARPLDRPTTGDR